MSPYFLPGRRLFETTPALPRLRLAVDLSHLRPGGESGGVKPFVFEYLRELAALEGERLTLVFLTSSAVHDEIRMLARTHDELVCILHNGGNPPPPGSWRVGELFLSEVPRHLLLLLEIDVFYAPLISAELACPGIPTLTTIVDVLHRDYPSTLPAAGNTDRERLFRQLVQVSDRFQCISEYTAGQMHRHYAVPKERTFCSHIIIHRRLGHVPDPLPASPYFLYPANAWPHKNHETLLIAYRLYARRQGAGAWKLMLTGHDSPAMRQILAHARHLGLEDQVVFHGHLDAHQFSQVWQRAGALVFPSLHEGFGIPLVEAMHFGVPILSSQAGSLPEVAADAALYADAQDPVAWSDALAAMASDPALRADLVARGRRRLGEFSLAAEIAEFRDVILDLAVRTSPRRWHKGRHPDGWIEETAILGLPSTPGPLQVTLEIAPGPATRRVRLYRGLRPLGGFDVTAGIGVMHAVSLENGRLPLLIEVTDAVSLSTDDARQHGVILTAASALDHTGVSHNLLEEPS